MNLKGIVIGDIHFGINESGRLYDELQEILLTDLEQNDYNFLIINGDYFDKRLSLNDHYSSLAISIMSSIMRIARNKKMKVRIINGTKTHDLNQLSTFLHYTGDTKYDFKIITKVETEELFDGYNVLYIPEEYLENQFEYYADYKKDNKYDLIVGHGTWSSQVFIGQEDKENNKKILSAPILVENEWKETLKENGKIIFGHIHTRYVSEDGILYYPGAFTAWDFGSTGLKGYARITASENSNDVELVDNIMCPMYITHKIDGREIELEEMIETIEKCIKKSSDNNWNKFKVFEANTEYQNILNKKYSNRKVKFEFKNKSKILTSIDKEQQEFIDRYGYILNDKISIEDMLRKFLIEERKIDMPLSQITEIISEEKNG